MDKTQLIYDEFKDLVPQGCLEKYLSRARGHSVTPFEVGFKINTLDDVVWFNNHVDGAEVRSAIINNMDGGSDSVEVIRKFIQDLKRTS